MTARVEQAGVDLVIDLDDDLPELLAEELGFKQVMLNLIGNAIKFTPKGGKVGVTATVQDSGEMYIDIADTGIGMSDLEIKKAMQPFGKVDTSFSGMKEGTGLGLTIVDSLVRLHGGSFRLISEKGVGTTARVIMPASRVLLAHEDKAPPKRLTPAGNLRTKAAASLYQKRVSGTKALRILRRGEARVRGFPAVW